MNHLALSTGRLMCCIYFFNGLNRKTNIKLWIFFVLFAKVSPTGPERRHTQHPLWDLPRATAQQEQHGLQWTGPVHLAAGEWNCWQMWIREPPLISPSTSVCTQTPEEYCWWWCSSSFNQNKRFWFPTLKKIDGGLFLFFFFSFFNYWTN